MKADIHPEYMLTTVHCSCGNTFQTRSTKPELHVEICSNCHPFYTGKQKLVDTGGRVERFQRRLEKAERAQRSRAEGLRSMAAIGGQAVLEGVMMRGPRNWAVAVRKPDGEIAHVAKPIDPLAARHWALRLPIVRGVVALGESLSIGFRALSVSANYAAQEEEQGDGEPAEIGRWAMAFAFLVAIGFAIAVFKVGPALLTDTLPISNGNYFVLIEGLVRVTVFVLYLTALSFIPSLKRVFEYHAAEHKAINAYEAGEDLTPEVAQRYSLIHPRCGTAFLLWVMVISVFVYALLGRPVWYWLIISRILLLPVIAGIAYELIRFAGKHSENRFVMTLLAPGLWLQRLTTRQPTLDQLEVSIRALREVLELEGRGTPADRRVEVMA
jgi:ribosomal protein L31